MRFAEILYPSDEAIAEALQRLRAAGETVDELPPYRCLMRRFIVNGQHRYLANGIIRRALDRRAGAYRWPMTELLGRESFGRRATAYVGRLGVPNPLHLDSGDVVTFAARWIMPTTSQQFRFAEADEAGRIFAVVMPWPSFDRCDDLVAFVPGSSVQWTLTGFADWLGETKARSVKGRTFIRLFRSADSWVRGRGAGVCVLGGLGDPRVADRLRAIKDITCDDRQHAVAVKAALTRSRQRDPKLFYEDVA